MISDSITKLPRINYLFELSTPILFLLLALQFERSRGWALWKNWRIVWPSKNTTQSLSPSSNRRPQQPEGIRSFIQRTLVLSSGIFKCHRKNDKCSRPSTTTTTTASTTSGEGEEEAEEEARRQSGGKKLSVKDLLASIPVDPITSDSLLPKGFAGAKRPKPKKPVPPPSSTTAAGNTT